MKHHYLSVFILPLLLFCGCARLDDPQQLLLDAADAAAAGRWQTAAEMTERCLRADRANVQALTLHGIIMSHLRRPEDAIDAFGRALTTAPEDFTANYFLGWVLCETGRFSDALEPLQRALKAGGSNPDVLALLARVCLNQNLPQGLAYLQALRRYRIFEQNPEIYNAMGLLWLYQRDLERAEKSFLEALSRSRENPLVLQNLAVLYDQYMRQPEKALGYYRRCLSASQALDDHQRAALVRHRMQQIALTRAN